MSDIVEDKSGASSDSHTPDDREIMETDSRRVHAVPVDEYPNIEEDLLH